MPLRAGPVRAAAVWRGLVGSILAFGNAAGRAPVLRARLPSIAPAPVVAMVQRASRGETGAAPAGPGGPAGAPVRGVDGCAQVCVGLWARVRGDAGWAGGPLEGGVGVEPWTRLDLGLGLGSGADALRGAPGAGAGAGASDDVPDDVTEVDDGHSHGHNHNHAAAAAAAGTGAPAQQPSPAFTGTTMPSSSQNDFPSAHRAPGYGNGNGFSNGYGNGYSNGYSSGDGGGGGSEGAGRKRPYDGAPPSSGHAKYVGTHGHSGDNNPYAHNQSHSNGSGHGDGHGDTGGFPEETHESDYYEGAHGGYAHTYGGYGGYGAPRDTSNVENEGN